jgi:cyclopropane fatty-acyl-phospholipid synthase-like methyltransferase
MNILKNIKPLVRYLFGESIFTVGYYREAELTRLLNMFAHVNIQEWKNYKILETGAGHGAMGKTLLDLGFNVTSTDGRPEFVEVMKRQGRKAEVLDVNRQEITEVGNFDIILSFGLLYHINNPEYFINNCAKNCKVMVLETVVCDKKEPVLNSVEEAGGWRGKDQALDKKGCRPSPAWIEETARKAGFTLIRDISSSVGNWDNGKFDWEPKNNGEWKRNGYTLRKMWVFEK